MSKTHSSLRAAASAAMAQAAEAAEPDPAAKDRSTIPSALVSDRMPPAGPGADACCEDDHVSHAREVRAKEERLHAGLARLRQALQAAENARVELAAENARLRAELTQARNA